MEELLPIEKAEKYGIEALVPSELLAIILRTGQPGFPVTELTAELMKRNDNRLKMLERRSRQELMELPGIGRVKAFQIEAVLEIMRRYNLEKFGDRPVIRTSRDIFLYMKDKASKLPIEKIWLLLLTRGNAVIDCKEMSSGGTTASVFDIKTILRQVLLTPGIDSLAMIHNHPSGSLRPSPQDDSITRMLCQGCGYIGIRVIDHVIVTQDDFYSYADTGRLGDFK